MEVCSARGRARTAAPRSLLSEQSRGGGGEPMPSNDEIQATLCAPAQFFEIETVDIEGVPTRAWKNAPSRLDAVLIQGAAAAGARDFLVLDDERISHEGHLRLAERFASSLVELGVRKGDRVAIAMRNVPE